MMEVAKENEVILYNDQSSNESSGMMEITVSDEVITS